MTTIIAIMENSHKWTRGCTAGLCERSVPIRDIVAYTDGAGYPTTTNAWVPKLSKSVKPAKSSEELAKATKRSKLEKGSDDDAREHGRDDEHVHAGRADDEEDEGLLLAAKNEEVVAMFSGPTNAPNGTGNGNNETMANG